MKKIVAAILMISICVLSYARIGETQEQCSQRYGGPIRSDAPGGIWSFRRANLYIFVHFFEGKADMISFRKVGEDILKIPDELSENEINMLLSSNGDGHEWKKSENFSLDSDWQTDNAGLLAHLTNNVLMIATRGYIDRDIALKKQKESDNLTGF